MKIWIIYKHTCKANGKSYIGQTCQKDFKQRWRFGKGYKGSTLFYNAILKFGWDNFTHEILESNILSLDEANTRERYWISYYHTWKYDPECNGYNLTPGGDSVEGSRLMSKDDLTVKVSPLDQGKFLEFGWVYHDSLEYRPIKHRKWYIEHKAEQNKRTKDYYEAHHEEIKAINKANCKKLYQDPEFKARKKQYRKDHPEVEEKIRKNYFNKHHTDPEFKRRHAEANKRWAEKKKRESSK